MEQNVPTPPQQPVLSVQVTHHSLWDAFEHVLLFLSLYTMATAIALILYYFVDKWVPGLTSDSTSLSSYPALDSLELTLLRGYLATLIVSFPIFSFLFLHIAQRTIRNPDMVNVKSRKILIYITLTVTFLIMLSNLIFLVYNFISGNVTWNFALRFFVTLFVAGCIFVYYLFQVKQDMKHHA